jgi:hypothetical protein
MNDKPPQVTDLKEAQLLINQLWLMVNSLTEKVHSLEKQIKEQKGKLSKTVKIAVNRLLLMVTINLNLKINVSQATVLLEDSRVIKVVR